MESASSYITEMSLTAEQVATLARINQSFYVSHFSLRVFDGRQASHNGIVAANARVESEARNSSAPAEWIIRADGEVLSRAHAADESGDWLKPDQERV